MAKGTQNPVIAIQGRDGKRRDLFRFAARQGDGSGHKARQRPGGQGGAGNGASHRKTLIGNSACHRCQHGRFAAEQMRRTGNVQE